MFKRWVLTVIFVGGLLVISSFAYAKHQSLGVFYMEGYAVPEALTISLTRLMRHQVASLGNYSVPTPDEMEIVTQHLIRQKEIDPNCNTDQCNIEIADAIGLELMILSTLFKEENHYSIKLRLMDTITPSTLNLVLMKSTLDENDLIESLQESLRILLERPSAETEITEELEEGVGMMVIESLPSGAAVTIDGEEKGTTPLLLDDEAVGKHVIKVARPKFLPWEETLFLHSEEVLKVKAELEDDWRKLKITSNPADADTYLNSLFIGSTPVVVSDLALGSYDIRIDKRGYQTLETTIAIAHERNNRLVVNLSPGLSQQEVWENEELQLVKRSEIERKMSEQDTEFVGKKRQKLMGSLSKTMVRIEDFWIDRFPYPNIVGEMPVEDINWYEAERICREEGKRLCSNEEWDKSCHGPFDFSSPFSDTYNKPKCRLQFGFLPEEIIIGTDADCVSDYGVYDMSGNFWEWTSGGTYTTSLMPTSEFRSEVFATWLWYYTFSGTRCSNRGDFSPRSYLGTHSFRCCKDTEEPFKP